MGSKLVIQCFGSTLTTALGSMPTTSPGPYISTLRGTVAVNAVSPSTGVPVIVRLTGIVARSLTVASWSAAEIWLAMPSRSQGRNE